jgi:hypothetical protein
MGGNSADTAEKAGVELGAYGMVEQPTANNQLAAGVALQQAQLNAQQETQALEAQTLVALSTLAVQRNNAILGYNLDTSALQIDDNKNARATGVELSNVALRGQEAAYNFDLQNKTLDYDFASTLGEIGLSQTREKNYFDRVMADLAVQNAVDDRARSTERYLGALSAEVDKALSSDQLTYGVVNSQAAQSIAQLQSNAEIQAAQIAGAAQVSAAKASKKKGLSFGFGPFSFGGSW